MKKLFHFTAIAFIATALSLGFASCSNDDDDSNEKKEEPNTGLAKLLPSKVTLLDEDGELYAESILTYNDKNQLIKSEYTDGDKDSFDFKYDAKGRLTNFGEDEYIYENNLVKYRAEGEGYRDNEDFTLDEKGILKSSILLYGNREFFYEFDKDHNLTKITDKEGKIIEAPTYSTYLSPFCNMSLPSFFMLADDIWGIQSTGLHMPTTFEGDTFKVVESKDNYPTKVKEFDEDGLLKFTYTITYQTMK